MNAALRRIAIPLLGAAALLLLVSGVSAATSDKCDANALARHEAIRAKDLENWEPVDDRTLLIWPSGSARAELVGLDRPIVGLAHAAIVVLIDSDRDEVISACGEDAIAIGEGEAQQARIVSMQLLSGKRTAELDRGAHATLPVHRV